MVMAIGVSAPLAPATAHHGAHRTHAFGHDGGQWHGRAPRHWEWHGGGVWWGYSPWDYVYLPPYAVAAPLAAPPGTILYCDAPPGYYPHVTVCSLPWRPVRIQP
jgi:hypothetical protein